MAIIIASCDRPTEDPSGALVVVHSSRGLADSGVRPGGVDTLAGMRALTAYRVMAYVTGVLLLVLVLVAVPLKYLADRPEAVAVVGFTHGWAYLVYVVTTLTLAYRSRWSPGKTVLVALAGTVPFASFVAERRVVRDQRVGV